MQHRNEDACHARQGRADRDKRLERPQTQVSVSAKPAMINIYTHVCRTRKLPTAVLLLRRTLLSEHAATAVAVPGQGTAPHLSTDTWNGGTGSSSRLVISMTSCAHATPSSDSRLDTQYSRQ